MTTETEMPAQLRTRTGPEAKAVDSWVRVSLRERFDDTLAETVPMELMALIEGFQP